jgi:hypothetical protein
MAKKKTTKKEEENDFDFKTCLASLEVPEMLKAGFGYYIEVNNITIKSENDLNKQLTKFKEMNAGV